MKNEMSYGTESNRLRSRFIRSITLISVGLATAIGLAGDVQAFTPKHAAVASASGDIATGVSVSAPTVLSLSSKAYGVLEITVTVMTNINDSMSIGSSINVVDRFGASSTINPDGPIQGSYGHKCSGNCIVKAIWWVDLGPHPEFKGASFTVQATAKSSAQSAPAVIGVMVNQVSRY